MSFIPEIHIEFEYVEICGERIGSRLSRQQRSSFIIASWVGAAGSVDMSSKDRPGRVDRLIRHRINTSQDWKDCILAEISWFEDHPAKTRFNGVTVWQPNSFKAFGASSFIPVQRVRSLFVPAYENIDGM